jgi:hypothetical protein
MQVVVESIRRVVRQMVAEGWNITRRQITPYLRAHINHFGAYATDGKFCEEVREGCRIGAVVRAPTRAAPR